MSRGLAGLGQRLGGGELLRAVQTRSRAGLLSASLRQRTSVPTPMPTSRETSSSAALCGGNNRATALSLNACPYRANVFSHRPLLVANRCQESRPNSARHQAVDLWTMRCAHRPACRGQRCALTTAPAFDHKVCSWTQRYKIYRDDNHSGAKHFRTAAPAHPRCPQCQRASAFERSALARRQAGCDAQLPGRGARRGRQCRHGTQRTPCF